MVTALDGQELLERLSTRLETEKGHSVTKDDPSTLKMEEVQDMSKIKHTEGTLEMATDS